MHALFKCDYCDYIDSKEKVAEHEASCFNNPVRCSCKTCDFSETKDCCKTYTCKKGKEIPSRQVYFKCPEWKFKKYFIVNDIFRFM